jgi:hypothetical protein
MAPLPLQLYRNGAMADDVILNAVPKVKWEFDTRQNGAWTLEPGLVDLYTRDGKRHSSEVKLAPRASGQSDDSEQRRRKLDRLRRRRAAIRRPSNGRDLRASCAWTNSRYRALTRLLS